MTLGLGSLITAGTGLFSSLFGGDTSQRTKEKSKTKTKSASITQTRSHLGQMVRAAERNGFNPLTVLRAGGLSAFATSETAGRTVSKSKSKGKNMTSSSAPLAAGIASAGQAIGAAVGDDGVDQAALGARDAWAGLRTVTTDPVAAKAQEYDLVQQQLKSANPSAATAGDTTLPGSSTWWQSAGPLGYDPKKAGELMPTFEAPTITSAVHPQTGWRANPWALDAEMSETRYGDILSNVAGVYNVGADLYWNRALIANTLKESAYTDADAKIVQGVINEVNPYIDTLKNTWDAIPPVVNSVTQAAVKKIQGEPPMSYIGRTDNRGYQRPTW